MRLTKMPVGRWIRAVRRLEMLCESIRYSSAAQLEGAAAKALHELKAERSPILAGLALRRMYEDLPAESVLRLELWRLSNLLLPYFSVKPVHPRRSALLDSPRDYAPRRLGTTRKATGAGLAVTAVESL